MTTLFKIFVNENQFSNHMYHGLNLCKLTDIIIWHLTTSQQWFGRVCHWKHCCSFPWISHSNRDEKIWNSMVTKGMDM